MARVIQGEWEDILTPDGHSHRRAKKTTTNPGGHSGSAPRLVEMYELEDAIRHGVRGTTAFLLTSPQVPTKRRSQGHDHAQED